MHSCKTCWQINSVPLLPVSRRLMAARSNILLRRKPATVPSDSHSNLNTSSLVSVTSRQRIYFAFRRVPIWSLISMDERLYCCCELVRTELQGTIMLLHTAETCTDKVEKSVVTQMVRNCSNLYGNRRLITVFTRSIS